MFHYLGSSPPSRTNGNAIRRRFLGETQQQQQQQPQQQEENIMMLPLSWNANGKLLTSVNQNQNQQQQQHVHNKYQNNNNNNNNYNNNNNNQYYDYDNASDTASNLTPVSEQSIFWSYTGFLGTALVLWMLYLMLPRGIRKQYCHAHVKRYAKSTDQDMPADGYWVPVKHVAPGSIASSSHNTMATPQPPHRPSHPHHATTATTRPHTPPRSQQLQQQQQQHRLTPPPSPEHPALKKIPPHQILDETMRRLKTRGIRLVAHGVHCDPKRVWIQLEIADGDTLPSFVTWQTEFPRRVPNQSGQVSIVLMRGSLHRIALNQVLYIDVGKKTNALASLQDETKVPSGSCFSLLTQNGSLDLQANSKLERDSLVSCFSVVLDQVHPHDDWRALYEASPEPSLANASAHQQQHVRY